MLSTDDLMYTLITTGDEIEFDYKDEHFWLSACCAPPGKVLMCSPNRQELVDRDIDVILDTLIVGGRPLREMLPYID